MRRYASPLKHSHRSWLKPAASSSTPLWRSSGQASVTDLRNHSPPEFIDILRCQPVGRALYYQVKLTGRIGAIDCEALQT